MRFAQHSAEGPGSLGHATSSALYDMHRALQRNRLQWRLRVTSRRYNSSLLHIQSAIKSIAQPNEVIGIIAEIGRLDAVEHRLDAARMAINAAADSRDLELVESTWAACLDHSVVDSAAGFEAARAALRTADPRRVTVACNILNGNFPADAPSRGSTSHLAPLDVIGDLARCGLQSTGQAQSRRVGLAAAVQLSKHANACNYGANTDTALALEWQQWAPPVAEQLLAPLTGDESVSDPLLTLASVLLAASREVAPPAWMQTTDKPLAHLVSQAAVEAALFWVACLPPSVTQALPAPARERLLSGIKAAVSGEAFSLPVSAGGLACALQATANLSPADTAGQHTVSLLSDMVERSPDTVQPVHFTLGLAALRAAPNADASACLLNLAMQWLPSQGVDSQQRTAVHSALQRPDMGTWLGAAIITAAQQVSQDRSLRVAAILRPAQELLALPQRACDLTPVWDAVLCALCIWEDGAALARFTAAMAKAGVACSPVGLAAVAAARGRARQRDFEVSVARAGVVRMQPVAPPTALGTSSVPSTSTALASTAEAVQGAGRGSSLTLQSPGTGRGGALAVSGVNPPPAAQRTVYAMPPLALPRTPPFSDEQWSLVLQGVLKVTASPLRHLQDARTAVGMSLTTPPTASSQASSKQNNPSKTSPFDAVLPVVDCGPSWAAHLVACGVRSLAEATNEQHLADAAGLAVKHLAAASDPYTGHAGLYAGPGGPEAWAVCSQAPPRLLGNAAGVRTPSDKHPWTPGMPPMDEAGLFQIVLKGPYTPTAQRKALHSALLTDLRRHLAAAAAAGDVPAAVDAADAIQLFDDELCTEDFEALIDVCVMAGQPNRADTLLGAMKLQVGKLSPTAVASTVQAHADAGAAAPAAMHLMTAVEAGMTLPEHVFWSVMNACGDAGAVLAVHDVLSAGQETGHARLKHIDGAVHKGVINVCGLRSGALSCLVWEALRNIRRDAELGRPVPHGLRIFCSKSQRVTLEAIFQSMDPPLQCNHVTPAASRPFMGVAPEELMAWLTTPSAGQDADGDEWAQSTSLPMRLAAVTGIASGRTSAAQAQLLLGDGSDLSPEDFGMLQPVAEDAADALSPEQAATSAEYAQWQSKFKKLSSYSRTRTQVDSARAHAAATRRQVARERQQAAEKRSADTRASMRPQNVRTLGKVLSGKDGARAWAGNGLHMATARTLQQKRPHNPQVATRDQEQR